MVRKTVTGKDQPMTGEEREILETPIGVFEDEFKKWDRKIKAEAALRRKKVSEAILRKNQDEWDKAKDHLKQKKLVDHDRSNWMRMVYVSMKQNLSPEHYKYLGPKGREQWILDHAGDEFSMKAYADILPKIEKYKGEGQEISLIDLLKKLVKNSEETLKFLKKQAKNKE